MRSHQSPAIIVFVLLAACSSYVVDSNYTPEVDFSTLKTYQWYSSQPRDPQSLEELGGAALDRGIRQAIDDTLQARGFVLQAEGEIDFKVNYDLLTEERQDIRSYSTYAGQMPSGGYGYGPMATTSTQVINYKQGQLIIDIIQPADEVLVWRGTAEGRITISKSPEKRQRKIRVTVNDILAYFPPRPR